MFKLGVGHGYFKMQQMGDLGLNKAYCWVTLVQRFTESSSLNIVWLTLR